MTLSKTVLRAIMLSVVMLNVAIFYCYAECRYAECRCAACRGTLMLCINKLECLSLASNEEASC